MPIIKIERIISFSSEDKIHVANNLLGTNTTLKWKCKTPGEKNAIVMFQLEKASVISGIDIGNEHSAYIEVLVARSGDTDSDFKTLLAMSSFMSALESRQSTNLNRVRMFKKDDFIQPECDEKWDRIKVVCTQTFNRHIQYGLSFIKFHTLESNTSETESGKKLGKFTLRPDSPVEFKPGYLFSKRKELAADDEKPLTAAAAIRNESFNLLNDTGIPRSPKLLPSCLTNLSKRKEHKDTNVIEDVPLKNRNRDELLYTEDEEKPHAKIDKLFELNKAEKHKNQEEKEKTPQLNKKRKKDESLPGTSKKKKEAQEAEMDTPKKKIKAESSSEKTTPKIKHNNESTQKKPNRSKITKPFYKLMEDVVFVISGIQNPDRAYLREMALDMGAKYKPDWDNSCTHLICAFMNTPKFNQVRGKGKIVTRKWIEDCHRQRKKIPWRRHALDKSEKDKDESEEEVMEKVQDSPPSTTNRFDDITMEEPSDIEERIERLKQNLTEKNENERPNEDSRLIDSPLNQQNSHSNSENNDPYSVETDTDEETQKRKDQIKNKPFDFFKGKIFFIDDNFEDYVAEMLKNYVFIHEGSLEDEPTGNVNYIICGKEEALNLKDVNLNAFCILPDWIVDCHKCKQFIPPDEYFIL